MVWWVEFCRCEDGTAATEPYICISILQKMLNLVQQDDKNKEEAEHLVWDCCSQIISELVHFTLMYQRSVMWGSELEPAQASVVATLKVSSSFSPAIADQCLYGCFFLTV